MIKSVLIVFFAISTLAPTCTRVRKVDKHPQKCLKSLIEQLEAAPPQIPRATIWQYVYRGDYVYLIPAPCCDQFNPVYNVDCKIICHPDGGITGKGDNQCNDFHDVASDKELVWEDPRSVE